MEQKFWFLTNSGQKEDAQMIREKVNWFEEESNLPGEAVYLVVKALGWEPES